ncbi:MAR-binding filament-like protein 1 isoform X2 [Panicum virgatum]|uniref:MAR-binding filament-like protein 1 isoform X2 n=1 Tax=Panicum virgatum TaxID=38727 RepID=UPI0019D550E7|nr:MAR-binding filament-like protein 1 isoform X2 [Panicum virgatum]
MTPRGGGPCSWSASPCYRSSASATLRLRQRRSGHSARRFIPSLVSNRTDIQKADGSQHEEPQEELPQSVVKVQHARNPLAGLLNAIAIMASGVFTVLLGTSHQEKKDLQSTISSMETKLVENEAAMSMLRENYEKRILDEQAELKKQARKFQEEEALLQDKLASSRRTVTSLTEEVQMEKELVEQLNLEIDRLKRTIAEAEVDKHMTEGKLNEKMEMLDILHDKINLLSQEVNGKDEHIRELSSSLSAKEKDYHNLSAIYSQAKENLEQANSQIKQLEKDILTDKDLKSKASLIDSLNEKVQTLCTEKVEAEEKISVLTSQYMDLKTASEERASLDSELLSEKNDKLNQLEEKLSDALSDSSKGRIRIAELNNELETTRTMLDNEVVARKRLSDLVHSTEEALRDSRNEVFKLTEDLDGVKRSNQDLMTQISKLTDEASEVREALAKKVEEAQSVSATLSDELVSVREVLKRSQEELEVISNQLVSVSEAHSDLNKELLDAYKRLESTTNELVKERKINATLNREFEALVKQSAIESEARKALQVDLDEATRSLNEVNQSTLSLSKQLETTNSKVSAIKEEKEMLSKALEEQKKSTVQAQENMEDAQNTIKRLGTERQSFEMRSKKLEDELATAKGEILRLRRQISTSGPENTKVILETGAAPNSSQPLKEQPVNDHVQNTNSAGALARSPKRIYRRRKGRPAA